jgi:hypothetical protein
LLLMRWRSRQGREGGTVGSPVVCRCSKQGMLWWMRWLLLRRMHPWPHRDGAGPGIVEGGTHRGALLLSLLLLSEPLEPLFLSFPFPLPLPLPLPPLLELGARGGGATGGHGGSCCGGHGGSCCCGGRPPPEDAEACPYATEWSSSISLSLRSLRTVWKEGNNCDRLMKIFM